MQFQHLHLTPDIEKIGVVANVCLKAQQVGIMQFLQLHMTSDIGENASTTFFVPESPAGRHHTGPPPAARC